MTNKTLIAAIVVLVVVLLGRKLFRGGKDAAARERFRRTIKHWRKNVEATHLHEFRPGDGLSFHVNVKHVPELEGHIVEVTPYVSSRQHKKMEEVFATYKALMPQPGGDKKNAPVKAQMLSLLDQIRKCAR